MNKEFLTADEISSLLRIPKRTVYKFAQKGQIPGTLRIGKHWRFHLQTVQKWILGELKQTSSHPLSKP